MNVETRLTASRIDTTRGGTAVSAPSRLGACCFVLSLVLPCFALADDSFGHHSKNHLSIIAGTSSVPDHDVTAFTIGFDFERELSPHFGVGVVAEHALGKLDATSVFAVADVHIRNGLVLQLGPGVEFIDNQSLAVGRVGLFQELHWGEMLVAPSVSYDFTKHADTIVFGFAVGTRF